MLIRLNSSRLFTTDPAVRFAAEYEVSVDTWRELWRRYKLLEYGIPDLCDYYQFKVGRQIKRRDIQRWIFRTEIYSLAQPILLKGAQVVNSSFFGLYEQRVVDEVLRHLKSGGTKDSRIMA